MLKELRVSAGKEANLFSRDPAGTPRAPGDEEATIAATAELLRRIQVLQERLYAEHERSVLVILQGVDCAGKDGTIRHVIRGMNPSGVEVTSFRQPTEEELAHDFLWRIHAHAPAVGHLAVFNRSYYEDVTTVRVRALVADKVWSERFDHIAAFERLLAHRGTTLVKFFLHISRAEQARRMRERVADPDKRWKLTADDLEDHERFDDYLTAYEEAIDRTSTDTFPWHVVPSNHKWYRNWAVAVTIHSVLVNLDPHPPVLPPLEGVDSLG